MYALHQEKMGYNVALTWKILAHLTPMLHEQQQKLDFLGSYWMGLRLLG